MAVYNTSQIMFHNNCLDKSKKVFINPNFNKTPVNNYPTNAVMHVNPRFSHLFNNVQPNLHTTRIHVNPNFMKSRTADSNLKLLSHTNMDTVLPKIINHNVNLVDKLEPSTVDKKSLFIPEPVSKSRYSLVRQSANKLIEGPLLDRPKNTFQLNKYKSIPLNDLKKSLDNSKTAHSCHNTNNTVISNKQYSNSSTAIGKVNKFKVVNHNKPTVKNDKIKIKINPEKQKRLILNQSRLKKVKGSLKKNNIPCQMFRKYGKCLREIWGKCEYLHDKKQVSICRKFIKGLCHDKNCLLSHDLTTKKMPTCYFYLQGTCTKTDCPYLHVKLSDNVRICPDFVKGYCEKGSKCLLRHVHTKKKDDNTSVAQSSSIHKRKYCKLKEKTSDLKKVKARLQKNDKNALTEKNENTLEYRYYQENKGDASATTTYEVIKPTRCKLGTLPSFIQL